MSLISQFFKNNVIWQFIICINQNLSIIEFLNISYFLVNALFSIYHHRP